MKVFGDFNVAAHPDLRLWGRLRPVEVDLSADGSAEILSGPVEIEVREIPVALRIPFHRRQVVVARVGPFQAQARPVSVAVRAARAHLRGTIGSDEGGVEASLAGNCRAELGLAGELRGRLDPDVEEHRDDDRDER